MIKKKGKELPSPHIPQLQPQDVDILVWFAVVSQVTNAKVQGSTPQMPMCSKLSLHDHYWEMLEL